MAVDFSGLFYDAPKRPVDFSPLTDAGMAMGRGIADAGQAIGAGLIERARLKEAEARRLEDKRQFDAQRAARLMLAEQEMSAKLRDDKRMEAQNAETIRHRQVMEQQGATGLQLEAGRLDEQRRSQARMEQRERRMAEEAALARINREAMAKSTVGLAQEMATRGILTDQELAMKKLELQDADPVMIRQIADELRTKGDAARQRLVDDDLRKTGPKLLQKSLDEHAKTLKEAGITVDPEEFLQARQAAVQFGDSYASGKDLAAEFKALHGQIAKVGSKKVNGSSEPKLTLPSGKQVSDATGIAQGGTFEEMSKRQREALFALGRESAKDDPNWVTPATAIGFATLRKGEALNEEEVAAAVESVPILQENLAIQHANEIASINGWKAGGKAQAAPAQAAAAPVTIDSLKARAIAEGWTKEQFFEEARKAGIK
jgi:hypothetical protein